MAARQLPAAADPCVRALVASDGMGGTVPLRDDNGGAVVVSGYGKGGAAPSRDESGRPAGLVSVSGAAGSDMCLPFANGQDVTTPSVTAGLAWPGRCDGEEKRRRRACS